MMPIVSRVLLLCAACLGTIPADKCLLMLAGDCCGESHFVRLVCHAHEQHDDAVDDGDDLTPTTSEHHHHANCVVLSSDSLALQAQHAPLLDVRQDKSPLCFVRVDNLAGSDEHRTCFDRRAGLKPPDPELFLLTHSFLI